MMVRDFQSVIGREARRQILQKEGRLPDYLVACVGGGSNAMGLFYPFVRDRKVKMLGVEAAGHGLRSRQTRRCSSRAAPWACCTAARATCCRTSAGRSPKPTRSRPGLDYPGVGPEHELSARLPAASQFDCGDRRRSDRSAFKCSPRSKASFPRWKAPMPSPRWRGWRRRCEEDRSSSSIFPAAATRT